MTAASAPRRYNWDKIRAEYEAGASQNSLAARYGISRPAIAKRIAREGWSQDITGTLDRLTQEKVAGLVAGCNPKKKAEALSRAADAKAAVIARHKAEWAAHQKLIDEALAADDFAKAKLAKITAETIRIRQEGERRAWDIVGKTALDHTSSDGSMSPKPAVLTQLSAEELLALTRAAFAESEK